MSLSAYYHHHLQCDWESFCGNFISAVPLLIIRFSFDDNNSNNNRMSFSGKKNLHLLMQIDDCNAAHFPN